MQEGHYVLVCVCVGGSNEFREGRGVFFSGKEE